MASRMKYLGFIPQSVIKQIEQNLRNDFFI